MIEAQKAINYLRAGLSVLPANRAQKRPCLPRWSEFQARLPTEPEVCRWFAGSHDAICIVCGKVSGNLEVIDFDNHGELFPTWKESIPGDLLAKLVIEQTPSGGYHVAYRIAEEPCGNIKLALGGRDGRETTLIETRGKGGLVLCSPTAGYTLLQGDFNALPILTEDEREVLLYAAWHMDERPHHAPQSDITGFKMYEPSGSNRFEQRPGDDFIMRGDMRSILIKHGWTPLGVQPDGNEYWRRPGKDSGNSATLKNGVFYVFSSNAAPFESNRGYNAFHVYTLLEHGGDFSAAASALREQGYGCERQEVAPVAELMLPAEKKVVRPWELVTNSDIREVLEDTILGELVRLYSCATIPPLPLEVALLKAIVSCGCALSEKRQPGFDSTQGNLRYVIQRGADLARLRIDTAGGQVCNAYVLTVGNSASGKDIGNLLDLAMDHYNWNLGTSGSAEGILDALIDIPNGLLNISEMQNYLEPRHYLSKSASTLTQTFSKGYFKMNLSHRCGGPPRECNYAYPNIYANIQPGVLEKYVRQTDISSGFLGRFIMALMPRFYGRPAIFDRQQILNELVICLDLFRRKEGVVTVPALYLNDISQMFQQESPQQLDSCWRRLVNEYGPRLAIMLSITREVSSQTARVELTDQCWEGAEKLVLWFFAHAEKLLSNVMDIGEFAKNREHTMRRILSTVMKFARNGARWSDISNYASHGTTKAERAEALDEMVDRGWIRSEGKRMITDKGRALSVGERYFVLNPPANALAFEG